MKKIIISCFFMMLLILAPLSGVAQISKVREIVNDSLQNEDLPKILITDDQKNQLTYFINITFEGEEKNLANEILNNIINTDLEVNLVNLSNKLSLYIYEPIPENELYGVTTQNELNDLLYTYWGVTENGFIENLFGSLLIKIIEIIKDRLGWFYDLFDKSISLFYGGITLFVDIIKPLSLTIAILFVDIVNEILSAPKVFIDSLKDLFEENYEKFTTSITDLIDQFSGTLLSLIAAIISFIQNPDIEDYFNELESFIIWIDEEHWKDPITVKGSVTWFLGIPLSNVTVSCRGNSVVTDSNGYFSFIVESPADDEDSFPKNEYYGMHNCQITISYNGEVLKQSPKILSYSFSGGIIDWPFILIKGKSYDKNHWNEPLGIFSIINQIQIFRQIFSKNMVN